MASDDKAFFILGSWVVYFEDVEVEVKSRNELSEDAEKSGENDGYWA